MSEALAHPESLPPRVKKRKPWVVALKLALLAVVLYFVGKALYKNFAELRRSGVSFELNYGYVLLALASLLLARLMNALNCATLVTALGNPIQARRVIPIIWIASLGRYIPGKMAVVAGALVMFSRQGVRVPVAMTAMFLGTMMVIILGLVACTPLLFTPQLREAFPQGAYISLAMLVVGAIALAPPVFLRLCNAVLKLLKREALPTAISPLLFWRAIGQTILRVLFQGLGLYFAARSLQVLDTHAYFTTLGAASLASVAGFMAPFAPAGLGVHEGIYLLTLRPLLGPKVALLVLLFRASHVVADAVAGAIATVMLRTNRPTDVSTDDLVASPRPAIDRG